MSLAEEDRLACQQIRVAGAVVEGGMALTAWGIGWVLGMDVPGMIQSTGSAWAWSVGATVPLVLGAALLWWWNPPPVQELVQFMLRHLGPILRQGNWLDLLMLSALAGLGEEALFRGVLQSWLQEHLGLWPAILVAAAAFGAAHALNRFYFLLATGVGIYLGWLFFYFENLLVPVVVHGLYDLVALSYLAYYSRRSPSPTAGTEEEPE